MQMIKWILKCPNGHDAVVEFSGNTLDDDSKWIEEQDEVLMINGGCNNKSCEYNNISKEQVDITIQIGDDTEWKI